MASGDRDAGEKMIDGLKTSNGKKSVEISKLKEDISHLKHELLERNERIKYLSEEVMAEKQERTDAHEWARSDRLATQSLRDELKEEQIAHKKLKEESTRAMLEAERQRESSLTEIQALQGRLTHLESEPHQFEIIESYHHNTLGKVEVVLAYKADYDYLEAQLSAEIRSDPDCFHYPPRVATCLDALQEIKKQGGGLVLDGESDVEDGEESVEEAGEGLAHDSWVSRPEGREGEEVEAEVQSTPLPTSAITTPLSSTPARGADLPASLSPTHLPSPTP